MSCNCVEEVNQRIKDKNVRIGVGLTLIENKRLSVVVLVAAEKIDKKKRGRVPSLIATYCPFCGKKWEEDKGENETAE